MTDINSNMSSQEQVILEKEIASLKRLLELARQKKDALLHEDMDTLVHLLKEEENELQVLEGIRPKGGNKTAQEEPSSEVSSSQEKLYQERKKLAREVKELNQFNQHLIDDSLAYIHFFLQLLQGEDGKNIYGVKGMKQNKNSNPVIDLKG